MELVHFGRCTGGGGHTAPSAGPPGLPGSPPVSKMRLQTPVIPIKTLFFQLFALKKPCHELHTPSFCGGLQCVCGPYYGPGFEWAVLLLHFVGEKPVLQRMKAKVAELSFEFYTPVLSVAPAPAPRILCGRPIGALGAHAHPGTAEGYREVTPPLLLAGAYGLVERKRRAPELSGVLCGGLLA